MFETFAFVAFAVGLIALETWIERRSVRKKKRMVMMARPKTSYELWVEKHGQP